MTVEQALVVIVAADATLTSEDMLGPGPRFFPVIGEQNGDLSYVVYNVRRVDPITTQDIALCSLREWAVQLDCYSGSYGECRGLANQLLAVLVKHGVYDGISSVILDRDMSLPEEVESKTFHIVLELCIMESLT